MGETDEFVPQSSDVEDETPQESTAEESVVSMTDAPSELDEISQSLATEGASEETAETAAENAVDDEPAVDSDASTEAATNSDSFDDIVAPVTATAAGTQEPSSAIAGQVPWLPFMVYLGAWLVLAVAAVWQLLQLPADQVVYESTAYVLTILGGLLMTAMGPMLILAVWLATRSNRSAQEREGLLTSALMKGALVTLGGAVIWWTSLVTIDYLRLGRLL